MEIVRKATALGIAALLAALSMPEGAFANPTGGTVAAGSASIANRPNRTIVHQHSDRAIINWSSFSIGAGETTRFKLPSGTSAVLNKVLSNDPSAIYGTLKSNGQVYLLNPNGILVGPSGVINAAAFIASTLNVSSANFMNGGGLTFTGSSNASIVNLGTLKASTGDVALLAGDVTNSGSISAPQGLALLGSGSTIYYAPGDFDAFVIKAPGSGKADNSGNVSAAAAALKAAGSPYALAVNNSGVISATAFHEVGGKIVLDAGDGTASMSGTLAANGGDEGGSAEVSGHNVAISGNVNVAGANGAKGTFLIDPATIDVGTDITAAAIESALASGYESVAATQSVTVDQAISSNATNLLDIQAPQITINQPISLPNGTLDLRNPSGAVSASSFTGSTLTSVASAALNASNMYVQAFQTTSLAGSVTTGNLEIDTRPNENGTNATSFQATASGNAISNLSFVNNNTYGYPIFTGSVAVDSSQAAMTVQGQVTADTIALSSSQLTLQADSDTLSVSGPSLFTSNTKMLLASYTSPFVNLAGPSVLAGSGRQVVYTSSDDGAYDLGGIGGLTAYAGVSYPADPQTGNVLYIANSSGLPLLTISADPASRYYGQPDPAFTYTPSTTGLTFATQPSFTITQGSDVNAGTYTILPYGAVVGGYRLSYVPGTLTVNPAPLTVTGGSASLTYGQSFTNTWTVSGFVNGDTLSSVGVSNVVFNTNPPSQPNAGVYAVTPIGVTLGSANYTPVFVSGSVTVNPATLTFSPLPAQVTYGVGSLPGFFYSVSGFQYGQSPVSVPVTASYSTIPLTAQTDAGVYALTMTAKVGSSNYVTAYQPGTLTVMSAPLTFTMPNASIIAGMSLSNLTFPSSDFSGWLNGDQGFYLAGLSLPLTSAATPTSPAGTYSLSLVPNTDPTYGLNYGFAKGHDYKLLPLGGITSTLTVQPQAASTLTFNLNTNAPLPDPSTLTVNPFTPPPTNILVTGNSATPSDYLFGGLLFGDQAENAYLEEQSVFSAYIAAMGGTPTQAQIFQALNDDSNDGVRDAMVAQLLPYLYADLQTILNTDQSQWTAQQAAFVQGMQDYIQQQRQSAAADAQQQYAAWQMQQQVNFQNDITAAGAAGIQESIVQSTTPTLPPSSFLQEATSGLFLTNGAVANINATTGDMSNNQALLTVYYDAYQKLAAGGATVTADALQQEVVNEIGSNPLGLLPGTIADASKILQSIDGLLGNVNNSALLTKISPALSATLFPGNNTAGIASANQAVQDAVKDAISSGAPVSDFAKAKAANPRLPGETQLDYNDRLVAAMKQMKAAQTTETGTDVTTTVSDSTKTVSEATQGVDEGTKVTETVTQTTDVVTTGVEAATDASRIASFSDVVEVAAPILEILGNVAQLGVGAYLYNSINQYTQQMNAAVTAANQPVTVADLKSMMNTNGGAQLLSYMTNMVTTSGYIPSVPPAPYVAPPAPPGNATITGGGL